MREQQRYRLRTSDGRTELYPTVGQAHDRLQFLARQHDLDVHLHPGSWAGHALSTAYSKGGDMFLDAEISVAAVRS